MTDSIEADEAPPKRHMTTLEACLICEGEKEADEATVLEAWAYLIRTGVVWSLQGFYGRTAADLIEGGTISRDGKVLV
ncbi:hypothetical protein [Planktothrix phage Pra-JY27]|nr:hypothetical protein [Planktothrix phage Pag-Yong1]WEV89263.1 hypothetical protein [Synechococcus phage MinM2]